MMQSRSNHTAKSGQFIVQNSRYGAKSLTLFCFKTAIVRCVFYEVRIGFLNTVKSISRINNLKLLVVAQLVKKLSGCLGIPQLLSCLHVLATAPHRQSFETISLFGIMLIQYVIFNIIPLHLPYLCLPSSLLTVSYRPYFAPSSFVCSNYQMFSGFIHIYI